MVYRKIQNEQGHYKDTQDVRWDILEAHEAHTPQGLNVGWDEQADLSAAVAAYGLTYDPLPEE